MKVSLITLFCVVYVALSAQTTTPCEPTLRPGVHTVQRGETLYGIARAYKITVEDLCKWNNLQSNAVLPQCISLWIRQPSSDGRLPTVAIEPPQIPLPYNTTPTATTPITYTRQSGNKHIVQPGETLDNLARLYGYTPERFRYFNRLGPTSEVPPGTELFSTDCVCPTAGTDQPNAGNTSPVPVPAASNSNTEPVQPATYSNTAMEESEMPYNVERAREQDELWNRNQMAEYEDREKASAQIGKPASKIDLGRRPDTYLSKEELQMIEEINLLRSNPKGYIQHIEAYIDYLRQKGDWTPAVATAYELIDELKLTPQLNTLQPAECLFRTAQKHGMDEVRRGYTGHDGSDGSWPWDRVLRECPQIKDGNENLVGGIADPRRAVITLLVDDGIEAHGHRKTLLNPEWRYVSCYKAGTVGKMPHCWVQVFGM